MQKVGTILKKARIKSKLTQQELAKKLGYDIPQFISLVENGHSKAPIDMCAKVSKILKINKRVLADALIYEYKKQIEGVFNGKN